MFLRKHYQLDIQAANKTLQNVFMACDVEPNAVPFDKLLLRQKARLAPINLRLILSLIILLFTLATPFLFISFYHEGAKIPIITLDEHYVEDGILYIKVETGDSSIDESYAYLITASGERISALSYDKENQLFAFPYLNEECNIYISGENTSTLHLLYTPLP